jgi:hypothetical protein
MKNKIDWGHVVPIAVIIAIGLYLCVLFSIIIYTRYDDWTRPHVPSADHTQINLYDKQYSITEEERDLMAKIVYLEARGCGSQCQQAVASVILNRLAAGHWGDSIEEVIYFPNAFSPSNMTEECVPDQDAYNAVDFVMVYGPTVPNYVMYFRDEYDHKWEGYEHYAVYDDIYFGFFANRDH